MGAHATNLPDLRKFCGGTVYIRPDTHNGSTKPVLRGKLDFGHLEDEGFFSVFLSDVVRLKTELDPSSRAGVVEVALPYDGDKVFTWSTTGMSFSDDPSGNWLQVYVRDGHGRQQRIRLSVPKLDGEVTPALRADPLALVGAVGVSPQRSPQGEAVGAG